MDHLLFLSIGIYTAVFGLTSKHLISESDMPATAEEKANDKPTVVRRFLVVSFGVVLAIYECGRLWSVAHH